MRPRMVKCRACGGDMVATTGHDRCSVCGVYDRLDGVFCQYGQVKLVNGKWVHVTPGMPADPEVEQGMQCAGSIPATAKCQSCKHYHLVKEVDHA